MTIKIGLVIQGPRFTHGNGPNNAVSSQGFDALETVNANVRQLSESVHSSVLSTWHKSGFNKGDLEDELILLESIPPKQFDYLNQKKQFLSTLVGANYLINNNQCTHIVKIRTDQLIPPGMIDWIAENFFLNAERNHYIIGSELIREVPFYIGDFIFAGSASQIRSLSESIINHPGRLAINNAADYVLKYLASNHQDLSQILTRSSLINQYLIESRQSSLSGLWLRALQRDFAVIDEKFYWQIQWRGRPLDSVLNAQKKSFVFYDEWRQYQQATPHIKALPLVKPPNSIVAKWKTVYSEIKRYWKSRLKFSFSSNA